MRLDKQKALQLRRQGKSYNEIHKLLGIPKSTLSGWLSTIKLGVKARQRIKNRVHAGSMKGLLKKNKEQTRLARERMKLTRKQSKQEIATLGAEALKLIGTALYWAEGYKRPIIRFGKERTHHPIQLTNSDPELIKIFLKFLRETCKVTDSNIHIDIRLFKHMHGEKIKKFWRKTTNLPNKNFGKLYYGVSKSCLGKRPFNRLPHGTACIRVNDTKLFHKIMGWIEGVMEQN